MHIKKSQSPQKTSQFRVFKKIQNNRENLVFDTRNAVFCTFSTFQLRICKYTRKHCIFNKKIESTRYAKLIHFTSISLKTKAKHIKSIRKHLKTRYLTIFKQVKKHLKKSSFRCKNDFNAFFLTFSAENVKNT